MKKVIFAVVVIGLFMTTSVISFAQEQGSMMGKGKKASIKGKTGEGMMDMYSMHTMMKMMMGKTMVAAEDGGVIVLIGNKLVKYDKDLNLVKEVKIKIDMKGMVKLMEEKCSMFKEKMQECGMMEQGSH